MKHFYLSAGGCDTAPGTKEQPFATWEAARDAVRPFAGKEAVTVHIAPGEYAVRSIAFTAQDSGTAEHPIVYKAEGAVRFNGGLRLSAADFAPLSPQEKSRLHGGAREEVLRADLKAYGLTAADWGPLPTVGTYHSARFYDDAITEPMWCELFFNDERMTIARYPDTGWLETVRLVREGPSDSTFRNGAVIHKPESLPILSKGNPKGDIWELDAATAARAAAADPQRYWVGISRLSGSC